MNAALWLEMDLRSLGGAVLLPEMPVGLHCKRAAVRVPEPSRDGRNIDAGLDAAGREKMAEIVMVNRFQADSRPAIAGTRPGTATDAGAENRDSLAGAQKKNL